MVAQRSTTDESPLAHVALNFLLVLLPMKIKPDPTREHLRALRTWKPRQGDEVSNLDAIHRRCGRATDERWRL